LVDQAKIGKVLIQYGFVEFQHEYDSVPGFWARFDERRTEMMGMLDRVIQGVARYGNVVILGRGSYAVLKGYTDVLNVRVQSPPEVRAVRVMAQQGLANLDQAKATVRENDNMRANFINTFYNLPWDSAGAFDVVLNTEKITPEMAVNWLAEIVAALDQQDFSDKRTTAALKGDSVLDGVISEILAGQPVR
jgi:cytidylate kinase